MFFNAQSTAKVISGRKERRRRRRSRRRRRRRRRRRKKEEKKKGKEKKKEREKKKTERVQAGNVQTQNTGRTMRIHDSIGNFPGPFSSLSFDLHRWGIFFPCETKKHTGRICFSSPSEGLDIHLLPALIKG